MSNLRDLHKTQKVRSGFVKVGRGGGLVVVKPHTAEYYVKGSSDVRKVRRPEDAKSTGDVIVLYDGRFREILRGKTPSSNWTRPEMEEVKRLGNEFASLAEERVKERLVDTAPKDLGSTRALVDEIFGSRSREEYVEVYNGFVEGVSSLVETPVMSGQINFAPGLPKDPGELMLETSVDKGVGALEYLGPFGSMNEGVLSPQAVLSRVMSAHSVRSFFRRSLSQVESVDPFSSVLEVSDRVRVSPDFLSVINLLVRRAREFNPENLGPDGNLGYLILPHLRGAFRSRDLESLVRLGILSYALDVVSFIHPLLEKGIRFVDALASLSIPTSILSFWDDPIRSNRRYSPVISRVFDLENPDIALIVFRLKRVLNGIPDDVLSRFERILRNDLKSVLGSERVVDVEGYVSIEAGPDSIIRMASYEETQSCQSIRCFEDLVGAGESRLPLVSAGVGNFDFFFGVRTEEGDLVARIPASYNPKIQKVLFHEGKIYGGSSGQAGRARDFLSGFVNLLTVRGLASRGRNPYSVMAQV